MSTVVAPSNPRPPPTRAWPPSWRPTARKCSTRSPRRPPSGQADPYDVETIHAEARAAFEHVLNRAGRTPPPPSGAVLVLLGEAGSGKTHLMRAFRTRAHGQGLGYCGYLQMTAEASNYARYMLTNLIDGLEQPYDPTGPSRTGLARLSAALLESVPGLSGTDMEAFRDGDSDGDPTRLADDYADRLQKAPRFRDCDLELLRVMLHLERTEPQVRSRALMWLRCQAHAPAGPRLDRRGGAAHRRRRPDEDVAAAREVDRHRPRRPAGAPHRPVGRHGQPVGPGRAVPQGHRRDHRIHRHRSQQRGCAGVPGGLLQGERRKTQQGQARSVGPRPGANPPARQPHAGRNPRNDRPAACATCTTRRRSRGRSGERAVPVPRCPPRQVEQHAVPRRARFPAATPSALHHRGPMGGAGGVDRPTCRPLSENDLDPALERLPLRFQATVPDGEEELAGVLADAIGAATAELPDGFHFELRSRTGGTWKSRPTGRTTGSTNCSSACATPARAASRSASKSSELEKRAGEIPVAIVRTTDFPKSGKAATQIAGMLKRHGRTVVVADADWRRMLAFEAFRKQHATRPDFAAWQKAARPLGELDSLQKILKLSASRRNPRAGGRRTTAGRCTNAVRRGSAWPRRFRFSSTAARLRGHSFSAARSVSRRPRSPSSRTSSPSMRRSSAGRAAARRRRR